MKSVVVFSKLNESRRTRKEEIRGKGEMLVRYNIHMSPSGWLGNISSLDQTCLTCCQDSDELCLSFVLLPFTIMEKQQYGILCVKSVHRPVKMRTIHMQKALVMLS